MYVQNFEIDEYYACIFTKQTITPVNYINTENTIWLILQYLHLQIKTGFDHMTNHSVSFLTCCLFLKCIRSNCWTHIYCTSWHFHNSMDIKINPFDPNTRFLLNIYTHGIRQWNNSEEKLSMLSMYSLFLPHVHYKNVTVTLQLMT